MTVLTFEENLLSPTLTAQHNHGNGTRVACVFTNHGFLPLDDNDVVLDHVDDVAAPYDLARRHRVRAWLIRNGLNLLVRQKMHVVSYSFSSEREE